MGRKRWIQILLLILAGESVFLLPFVFVRIFRPTVLKALELNNTELGWSFSVYGIVALISYFLGGFIADRIQPRYLIGSSLILTALGGLYLTTIPSPTEIMWLYGYWGMTTILLFWAPLIKATRVWGEADKQARAFGFLDSGRGAVAALIGVLGVGLFASGHSESTDYLIDDGRINAFRLIATTISLIVAAVGILVLLLLKSNGRATEKPNWNAIPKLLADAKIWLLMIIILTAYVGYKITDFFPQYATDVLKMSEYDAARIGTTLMITRPLTALAIALFADRFNKSNLTIWGFALLAASALLMSSGIIEDSRYALFICDMLITGIAVYAVRALYFSLIEDARFPIALTGTVVGFVSVIGFTPDIFVGPISGYFLDNYPGITGFQWLFFLLFLCSLLGMIAAIAFRYGTKNRSQSI